MGPNDGQVRVPHEESLYLIEVCRFGTLFCKRNVDIVVDQHNQANFRSKIKYAIQSWVLKACNFARYLPRYKLFVNRELADASEHAWEDLKHAADVVRRIHVCGIEACDHGIKTSLLFLR